MPSFHLIAPFRSLSASRPVVCVCQKKMLVSRAGMWKAPDFGNLKVFYLEEQDDVDSFVERLLMEMKEAIHFMSGFGTQEGTETFWRLARVYGIKPIVIAERPDYRKNPFKALLRDMFYYVRTRTINRRVSAVLCMGTLGVEAYRKYGFPERKLLHFMYTSAFSFPELPSEVSVGTPLRFVYVGRDRVWVKGLDLLVDALRGFSPNQLTFDFIGLDQDSWVVDFASKNNLNDLIRVLGKIPSDRIAINLANNYDVLVLLSRYDGWGMVVSEALFSGIGVLTSNACGSHDIVSASGAGKVLPVGSVAAIKAALLDLVSNPAKVYGWKIRAREYRDNLRAERLAFYLEEVIAYVERDCSGKKPFVYWLEKRADSEMNPIC